MNRYPNHPRGRVKNVNYNDLFLLKNIVSNRSDIGPQGVQKVRNREVTSQLRLEGKHGASPSSAAPPSTPTSWKFADVYSFI